MHRFTLVLALISLTLVCAACSGSSEKPDEPNIEKKTAPLAVETPAAKPVSEKMVITGINEGVEAGFKVAAIWMVRGEKSMDFYMYGSGVTTKDTFTLEFDKNIVPKHMRSVSGTKQLGMGMIMAWHKDAEMIRAEDGKIDPKGMTFAFGQAVDHGLVFAHDDSGELKAAVLKPGFKQDVIVCGEAVATETRKMLQPVSCDAIKLVSISKTGMKKPSWM